MIYAVPTFYCGCMSILWIEIIAHEPTPKMKAFCRNHECPEYNKEYFITFFEADSQYPFTILGCSDHSDHSDHSAYVPPTSNRP